MIIQPLVSTDDDYRALARVSNSDLTRLKEEHLGYGTGHPMRIPAAQANFEKAKVFGRAFHQHLLEPETVGSVLTQLLPDLVPGLFDAHSPERALQQTGKLETLMQTIRRDTFCRRYLRLSERERVILWDDPATGVGCKSRLDMVYTSPKRRNALVIDIKTTSARTQAQFLESCYTYDYDRQAAFYIDSLRHASTADWADTRQFRFVFVGVMKQRPHRLFAVDATSIPGFIDYGRKKYRFWLRKWREEQQLPQSAGRTAWQSLTA